MSGTTKQANYLKSLSFIFGGELYRESYITTELFGQFILLDYGTMISEILARSALCMVNEFFIQPVFWSMEYFNCLTSRLHMARLYKEHPSFVNW